VNRLIDYSVPSEVDTTGPAGSARPGSVETVAGGSARTATDRGRPSLALALLALGVVYGDIGTSPIYAFKAAFDPTYGLLPTRGDVYGVLSLIVWALTLTVSIKYVAVIMRADNNGEGGILALLAIIRGGRALGTMPPRLKALIGVGLFGAALLYGDGVITPAISVLSAVEGLGVASPHLATFAVPASVVILFILFFAQRFGVSRVGRVFGPIMLIWFLAIAVSGAVEIARAPRILSAVNPIYAVRFFGRHGTHGFVILGAVVLAVTGAEALFADMGYFGRRSIRRSWFGIVFPALLLNYAGQGALVIADRSSVTNPFFLLAPRALLYPYVALATMATIIASQALISGAFALTSQAMQLGYAPRLTVVHTAPHSEHVYIPAINRALMIACLVLVVTFRTSTALGAAYGIAVTGTMAITTTLFYDIARTEWHWPRWQVIPICGLFLAVDGAFLGANVLKVAHDGWVPLAIGAGVWILMTTWAWGRERLLDLRRRDAIPLRDFFARLAGEHIPRTPGTAVFLTSHPDGAPRVLVRDLDYTHVLASHVVLLNIAYEERPIVRNAERLSVTVLPHGFYRIIARFGFLQTPELPQIIAQCRTEGVALGGDNVVFYLSSERLIAVPTSNPIVRWRKALFRLMLRNSRSAPDFLGLPADRVVELGALVKF
jgi:KUP system potassium uptake protein